MGTGGTATLSSDEWLELYNPTSLPVDVGGWRLVSLTDNSPNITLASKNIDPYGFFLLERTNHDTISDISADQIYTGNLNDTGEMLELRDNAGILQDLVSVSADGRWYAGDKIIRSSMERIDPLKPGNDPTNWATNNGLVMNGLNAAGDLINGTPRNKNSVYSSQKPLAIGDLSVDSALSFFDRIKLLWSVPNDGDTKPRQLKYDLRYATHSFDTLADWDTAAVVGRSNMPKAVSPFGALQSASFSLFDFTGPTQNTTNSFTFSVTPTVATSCRDILSTGRAEDVPHPEVDAIEIYNTDTGQPIDNFGGDANQIICGFDYSDGHYSAVVVHQEELLSCYDSNGGWLNYDDCKNSPAFDGEVFFTINSQPFSFNQDYYFAIKTSDGEQWSDISNIAKYQAKPAISGSPTTFRGPVNPSISWQFELPAGFGVSQPGLAGDGTIYFGSSNYFQGKLYAINPNGTEKWRLDGFDNQAPTFPVVADDGVVYFGANGGLVYAVNPDKSIRWQSAGASGPVGKISIDANGNIMFTDTANIPVNDRVFKIKPNGAMKWNVFLLTASGFTPITGPDGDVYTSSRWGANGIPRYYRLNGDNGSVVWQVSPNASFVYSTSDLVYDQVENKLYAVSTSRFQLFTINPSDGQLTEDMIKPIIADPTTKVTVSGDVLVVGATLISNSPASGSAVYGIDKATKSVRWTFPISASASVNPYNSIVNKEIIADIDGNFYFSIKGGRVYSIDRNGQKRWEIDMGAVTDAYPILGNNAVFISAGGWLFKIAD